MHTAHANTRPSRGRVQILQRIGGTTGALPTHLSAKDTGGSPKNAGHHKTTDGAAAAPPPLFVPEPQGPENAQPLTPSRLRAGPVFTPRSHQQSPVAPAKSDSAGAQYAYTPFPETTMYQGYYLHTPPHVQSLPYYACLAQAHLAPQLQAHLAPALQLQSALTQPMHKALSIDPDRYSRMQANQFVPIVQSHAMTPAQRPDQHSRMQENQCVQAKLSTPIRTAGPPSAPVRSTAGVSAFAKLDPVSLELIKGLCMPCPNEVIKSTEMFALKSANMLAATPATIEDWTTLHSIANLCCVELKKRAADPVVERLLKEVQIRRLDIKFMGCMPSPTEYVLRATLMVRSPAPRLKHFAGRGDTTQDAICRMAIAVLQFLAEHYDFRWMEQPDPATVKFLENNPEYSRHGPMGIVYPAPFLSNLSEDVAALQAPALQTAGLQTAGLLAPAAQTAGPLAPAEPGRPDSPLVWTPISEKLVAGYVAPEPRILDTIRERLQSMSTPDGEQERARSAVCVMLENEGIRGRVWPAMAALHAQAERQGITLEYSIGKNCGMSVAAVAVCIPVQDLRHKLTPELGATDMLAIERAVREAARFLDTPPPSGTGNRTEGRFMGLFQQVR